MGLISHFPILIKTDVPLQSSFLKIIYLVRVYVFATPFPEYVFLFEQGVGWKVTPLVMYLGKTVQIRKAPKE